MPDGVICLHSALWFHGLHARQPDEVWMAIDRKAWKPRGDEMPLRIVRFSGAAFTEGVEIHTLEGLPVRIYSPAKTLADCRLTRPASSPPAVPPHDSSPAPRRTH